MGDSGYLTDTAAALKEPPLCIAIPVTYRGGTGSVRSSGAHIACEEVLPCLVFLAGDDRSQPIGFSHGCGRHGAQSTSSGPRACREGHPSEAFLNFRKSSQTSMIRISISKLHSLALAATRMPQAECSRRDRGELTRRRVYDFSRGDIDDVARISSRRLRWTARRDLGPARWPKHSLHEQGESRGERNGGSHDQPRRDREEAEECDN
jgi:hypothetical protein